MKHVGPIEILAENYTVLLFYWTIWGRISVTPLQIHWMFHHLLLLISCDHLCADI